MFYLKALHKLFADVCKTIQPAIVLLLVRELKLSHSPSKFYGDN